MTRIGDWSKWVVAALGLLLVVGAASAQPRPPATGVGSAAPLGTGFTFQGRLSDTAGPVDGVCSFTFQLYDSAGSGSPPTGGTLLGTDIQTAVAVTGGNFAVVLNEGGEFGADAFVGEARWLQITVDCGGGPSTLSPRQALTATPYALYAVKAPEHSHWGQTWSGSGTGLILGGGTIGLSSTAGNFGVQGYGTGSVGTGVFGGGYIGVSGYSSAELGRGVYGRADHSSSTTYGVYGQSESPGGIGVYGQVLGTAAGNYGVAGYSESSAGTGVFGWASASSGDTRGVTGRTDSPTGSGVYGLSRASSGESSGVLGHSDADSGTGVYGEGRWGVQGHSTSNNLGVGVYGESSSETLGIGVLGDSNSQTLGIGVYGTAAGSDSVGVSGLSANGTGVLGTGSVGVKGESNSAGGSGVLGTGYAGVVGESSVVPGRGVMGNHTGTSGVTYGVIGYSASPDGYAGYFRNTSSGVAVRAQTDTGTDNIIEAWSSFSSQQFRVERDGDVWSAGAYESGAVTCFAVMMPAVEGLEPGDVLVMGEDGRVTRATEYQQETVVGVYASNPAYLAGHSDVGGGTLVPVAVAGVVPVKVYTLLGIEVGTPLVSSSSYPGRAIELIGGSGDFCVLGKALESLRPPPGVNTWATGVIDMLVMLR